MWLSKTVPHGWRVTGAVGTAAVGIALVVRANEIGSAAGMLVGLAAIASVAVVLVATAGLARLWPASLLLVALTHVVVLVGLGALAAAALVIGFGLAVAALVIALVIGIIAAVLG